MVFYASFCYCFTFMQVSDAALHTAIDCVWLGQKWNERRVREGRSLRILYIRSKSHDTATFCENTHKWITLKLAGGRLGWIHDEDQPLILLSSLNTISNVKHTLTHALADNLRAFNRLPFGFFFRPFLALLYAYRSTLSHPHQCALI